MKECPVCSSPEWDELSEDRFVEGNRYLRCRRCGSGFCLKDFDPASADSYYEEFYGSDGSLESMRWSRESKHLLGVSKRYLKLLSGFKPSGRLLDLGCGRAEFIYQARQTGRYDCVGVEPSARAAREAEELFGIKVIVSTFNPELFADKKFDVIYMRHLLEHIPDPRQFVDGLKSVCAPGAVVGVHLPNDTSFTNAFKRFIYRLGKTREYGAMLYPYHMVGYTPSSLRLLFEQAGFTHLMTRTFSKFNPLYDFHWRYFDILLVPFSILDILPGRGNSIVSYFRLDNPQGDTHEWRPLI